MAGLATAYTTAMQMEDLQRACVKALAAHAGVNVADGEHHDTYKNDLSFTMVAGDPPRLVNVRAQLKSTSRLPRDAEGNLLYDLDVHAYNILADPNLSNIPYVLILMEIPDDTNLWTETDHERTRIVRRNFFVPLYGKPASDNGSTKRIPIGTGGLLSAKNFKQLMASAAEQHEKLGPRGGQ